METLPRLRMQKGRTKRILEDHPWVFSNELQQVPPLPPGTLVMVDAPGGEPLGMGYYNPHSLIAVRWLQRGASGVDGDWLEVRLKRAVAMRERRYAGEDCARLVFSEGDDLPGLVVDRYGDALVLQTQTAGMEAMRSRVETALRDLLNPRVLVRKDDGSARELEGLERKVELVPEGAADTADVNYLGLRLSVPLARGQKTGLFLDQRDNVRAFLGLMPPGARVLDAFCYLGVWGMTALKAGAASAQFVDASGEACEAVQRGLKANDLPDCDIHRGDALQVLEVLRAKGERFDAVILDPPAFARSRKHLTEALKAYRRINELAISLVAKGGMLVSCSCSHHVSREDFRGALAQAASRSKRRIRLLAFRGQAADHPVLLRFPEGEYLKCAILEM